MGEPGSAIGVMGGTFDPIHFGHLLIAQAALAEFALDRVVFVPAGHPPHKRADDVTSSRHRYVMSVLATADNPRFHVSRVEMDRSGPTFTVDTMRMLTERHPRSRFFFITGADAMLDILTWKQPDELLDVCEIAVASRPGVSLDTVSGPLGAFLERHQQRIHRLEAPAVDVSSTDVRRRVGADRSIRYFVPDAVMHYIRKHRLYESGNVVETAKRYSMDAEESE